MWAWSAMYLEQLVSIYGNEPKVQSTCLPYYFFIILIDIKKHSLKWLDMQTTKDQVKKMKVQQFRKWIMLKVILQQTDQLS